MALTPQNDAEWLAVQFLLSNLRQGKKDSYPSNHELINALEQIFAWWDLKDGHLVTHFHTVDKEMEKIREIYNKYKNE